MGCPVNSIQAMEEGLRYRRQKLVVVILASANSDSRAVDFVLRNFHEMDIISDDVDFYMPGYGINKYNHQGVGDIEETERMNNDLFPDFHYKRSRLLSLFTLSIPSCRYIDSPRLGKIVFNLAEFTDFVLEFTRRIKGFHYLGGCQMILIPPLENGKPNYNQSSVYDLDAVIGSPYGSSLDSFLHRTFQTIREADDYVDSIYHRNPILRSLFGSTVNNIQSNSIVSKIDSMYHESTRMRDLEEGYEIVINNIIVEMNRCLQWNIIEENFYFISYSSRNVMQAETIKRLLQQQNIHVWIAPDGIPQGREYPIVIPTALKLAKVFVLLLTPDSARSQWVRRELAIAIGNNANTKVKVLLSEGMTISDIRADNELEFLLDRVQVKFDYSDVVHSLEALDKFIRE